MSRIDIDLILGRVEFLAREINELVPNDTKSIQFRADLAGLLVVSIVASYESSVKETLINFATRHHIQFGNYAQNQFSRMNSRIGLTDLYKYARTFDNSVHDKFGNIIKLRKAKIMNRTGKDFTKSYEQILSWRHDFAHAGIRNTTVEEAVKTHRFAKRVIYSFDMAFNSHNC